MSMIFERVPFQDYCREPFLHYNKYPRWRAPKDLKVIPVYKFSQITFR